MWVIILFILHFSKKMWNKLHFKFSYSGVYLQKCKVTGNPILLVVLSFCLKVGMSKMIEIDLDLWPLSPISKFYHKIEFCNDTCTQNALWLIKKLPAFHILVVQITIPCINQHSLWKEKESLTEISHNIPLTLYFTLSFNQSMYLILLMVSMIPYF